MNIQKEEKNELIYKAALDTLSKEEENLINLARKIWENPETGFNEVKASSWIGDALTDYGFRVEKNAFGLPTALRAVWGSGHPVIGILAEYDALPGMSQQVTDKKSPVTDGAPGHACAHNLLGTASLGAAAAIKAGLEAGGLPGTIVYYGCPAEETLLGKGFMARKGAFRDLDLAFSWHGSANNLLMDGCITALNSVVFHFKGLTAHAGGDPQNGRSALDAAELMNVGANYLREHVPPDVRIHYSYKEAGTVPNLVPDKASVWYYIRAYSRETVEDTYRRLIKVAEGAAHMTETELTVEFLGGCYNTLNNKTLVQIVHETMKEIERPFYTDEELSFADRLNQTSPKYAAALAAGTCTPAVNRSVLDIIHTNSPGSSDVGDVMHIVPCIQILTATYNKLATGHSWQIAACAGHSIGFKGMLYGAKVMAASALRIYEQPELAEKAKAEFEQEMKGQTYICPIPDEVMPPLPSLGTEYF